MGFEEKNADVSTRLKCSNCGAPLVFQPGTDSLVCPYCGAENTIQNKKSEVIHSFDYEKFIHYQEEAIVNDVFSVKCANCGATTTLPENVNAADCPFCDSPLVITQSQKGKVIQPHYVLPFFFDEKKAIDLYKKWMAKLWFAPNDLVKNINETKRDKVIGIYLPYWSYDFKTQTDYAGERGDYYYTTETYTVRVDDHDEERTEQVRHTDWTYVRGDVYCSFDNILVIASKSLERRVTNKLGPWNLQALRTYKEEYLSGFRSELYALNAEDGFAQAKNIVDSSIRNAIRNDIGGDEQRIRNYDTNYSNIGLKYNLLPIWITAFHFKGKLYQIVVNGCTGEVIGDRPYSAGKIILAILIGLLIVGLIYLYANQANG